MSGQDIPAGTPEVTGIRLVRHDLSGLSYEVAGVPRDREVGVASTEHLDGEEQQGGSQHEPRHEGDTCLHGGMVVRRARGRHEFLREE